MKILRNIYTAVKGGIHEVGEYVIELQSIRIVKEKMREAEKAIQKATDAQSTIMVDKDYIQKEIDIIHQKISEYEVYIKQCLRINNESLAHEVAEKINELEQELQVRNAQITKFEETEALISTHRKKATLHLNDLKRNISLIEAQKNVNDAMKATNEVIGINHFPLAENESFLNKLNLKIEKDYSKLMMLEKIHQQGSVSPIEEKLSETGLLVNGQTQVDTILNRLRENL